MADKKISALTGATTPLAGTEVLPIVQGGATVKVSIADLTAGRAVGSAGGTFTDNHVQGTAAKGVNFTANTPAAGMTSRLLNWYEEGTWTPAITLGSGSVTYTSRAGRYTRIGRLVTIEGTIVLASVSTPASSLSITGLPFTVNAAVPAGVAMLYNNCGSNVLMGQSVNSGTSLIFYKYVAGALANAGDVLTATSTITFSITYSV